MTISFPPKMLEPTQQFFSRWRHWFPGEEISPLDATKDGLRKYDPRYLEYRQIQIPWYDLILIYENELKHIYVQERKNKQTLILADFSREIPASPSVLHLSEYASNSQEQKNQIVENMLDGIVPFTFNQLEATNSLKFMEAILIKNL